VRAAAITISTSRATAPDEDRSGPRLVALAESLGATDVVSRVVADRADEIQATLLRCADELACELILTSGGTGFSPDDVTPEATAAVIERPAPGLAEAVRQGSRENTKHWMLSRGLAGIRGRSLIINLPGNPASIDQVADVLREALPHGLSQLRGELHSHRGR
jgi:molybdopterin adenylyltransferase